MKADVPEISYGLLYLSEYSKKKANGMARRRRCQAPWWEAECPCLGSQVSEAVGAWALCTVTWIEKDVPFHLESATAMRIYHTCHTTLKWLITCKNDLRPTGKQRAAAAFYVPKGLELSVSVMPQLSRTISSCHRSRPFLFQRGVA